MHDEQENKGARTGEIRALWGVNGDRYLTVPAAVPVNVLGPVLIVPAAPPCISIIGMA